MLREIAAATLLLSTTFASAADEKDWVSLFDGKSLSGWTSAGGGEPGKGWKIEDGCIHRAAAGGDLLSEKEYSDFEFEFEWKIAAKGNSGVKYRVRRSAGGWVGPEYQVLDDAGHPNGKVADTSAASLYEVMPAEKRKDLNPAGEWNVSRIVARGPVLEHWLNGKLAMKIDTTKREWDKHKQESKFARVEDFAAPGPGKLLLQDHGDGVWFRNLRIRPIAQQ